MADETRLMLTAQECATLFESQTHKHFGENWLCHKDGTSADCETPIVRASLEVAFARGVAAGVEQNGLRFQAAIKEALERPRTPSCGIHSSTALANLGDCVVCAYFTGRAEQRKRAAAELRAAAPNEGYARTCMLAMAERFESAAIEKKSAGPRLRTCPISGCTEPGSHEHPSGGPDEIRCGPGEKHCTGGHDGLDEPMPCPNHLREVR